MLPKNKLIECPRCWVKMNQTEINVLGPNVIIDVCPKCNGVWFDKGELKKILKDRKLSDYLTKNIGTQTKSELVCPRCGGLMDIEKAEEIEVDVCLECNGVWLDQGELEDLKSKSEKGFHGNETEKALEKWEEMVKRNRESGFNRFIRKLTR
ncbi:MAG: transcription factor [Euryarchaeota archaeon CG_4_9_14_3_um_filter_38_12]|nr:MAG: transcription factor [Euryarchaeota archaeon CG_4_9_14_3_um_filter_38_12]